MSRATPLRTAGSGESMKLPPYLTTKVCAAELLDVGQRFEQRFGFGDEILHVRGSGIVVCAAGYLVGLAPFTFS